MVGIKQYLAPLLAAVFVFFGGSVARSETMARMSQDGRWAMVPLADGFDYPVGKPDGEGYYKSRGLRLNMPRHMGEDWNGNGGGNSDDGDPVYTVGTGLVTYAADARGRWGKVVIVRHAFRDPKTGKVLCCQTLYGHLGSIDVKLGQIVRRGDVPCSFARGIAFQRTCQLWAAGDPQDGAQLRASFPLHRALPAAEAGKQRGAPSCRVFSAVQGHGRAVMP